MAIHDLWSFDNAPQSSTDISQGTSLTYPNQGTYFQYTNLPGVLYKNTGGSATITSDGYLNLISSSSWNPALVIRANDVQDWSVATQYWMGFRTKIVGLANIGTTAVFRLANTLAQGTLTTLLSESDFTAAGAATVGTEYYVEVFIDRSALTFQVYINGTMVKSGALTAGSTVAAGACYYFWGGMNSASATANATRSFRDFYFLDVDSVDKTRLGPIRSARAGLTSIAGSEWTLNSAADLSTALTTALQSPPVTTPSVSSPADLQPITASLTTGIAAATPIIAVQPQLSVIGDSKLNQVDIAFSQASQQLDTGKILIGANVTQYNQRWAIQRKAPDGGVWTPAKLSATQATLTPSGPPPTSLLLHFDGANGSTTYTDAAQGHVMTNNGNGTISTAQSKFGGASYSPGSSGFVSTVADNTLVMGSTCTIEGWAYRTGALGDTTVLSCKTANSGTTQTGITQQSGMALGIILTDGAGAHSLSGAAAFPLNQWNHWAVVYNNGVYTGYINGVNVGTFTSANTFGLAGGTYTVGGNQYNGASQFPGYLDEIRISNVARYNANFTPPVKPFGADGVALASVFSSTTLTSTQSPAGATTTTALIPSIMADAGVNLVPEDIVNTAVAANATTVTLTVAATSTTYVPGTSVTLTLAVRPKTSLLMHFDNAGSTTYTDDVGHAVTNSGAAAPSTNTVFGAGSFPSGAGYLSVANGTDLQLTGDLTIEGWAYHNNVTQNGFLLSKGTSAQSGYQYIQSTSGLFRILGADGSVIVGTPDSTAIKATTWQHFAFVKSGTTWRLFIDGALIATATSSQTFGNNTYPLFVGKFVNSGSDLFFNGLIDELRISSVARYQSAFTRPAAPFTIADNPSIASVFSSTTLTNLQSPSSATTTTALIASIMADAGVNLTPEDVASVAVAAGATTVTLTVPAGSVNYLPGSSVTLTFAPTPVNTALLLHFDNNLKVQGTAAATVTAFGSAAVTTAQSKFGNSSLSLGATAASYLSIPDHPDLEITGAEDCTIEFWAYNTDLTTTQIPFGKDTTTAPYAHVTFASSKFSMYADTSSFILNGTISYAVNTWNHIAYVRSGGLWTIYVNGVSLGSTATSYTFGNNSAAFFIGNWAGKNARWLGYLDEFRVSKIARYTANFTPPTAPFVVD